MKTKIIQQIDEQILYLRVNGKIIKDTENLNNRMTK
jgi:hypothetical protein